VRGIGSRFCGIGSNFSINQTFSDKTQLLPEQGNLPQSDKEQGQSKHPEPKRIISDPLRFVGKFFINRRFLLAFPLLLVGPLFAVGAGEYFYRERALIGAALLGCGWLCAFCAWWIATGAPL
jgi:hypothetical protein